MYLSCVFYLFIYFFFLHSWKVTLVGVPVTSVEAWLFFIQKNPTKSNSVSKFIIPYLYEVQHVSGDTVHHQEPKTALAASDLHTWKVVGRVVAGR